MDVTSSSEDISARFDDPRGTRYKQKRCAANNKRTLETKNERCKTKKRTLQAKTQTAKTAASNGTR